MRLFIAIPLPKEVVNHVRRIQKALSRLGLEARWIPPRNLHLTLKFLGEVDSQQIPLIGAALQNVCRKFNSLLLKTGGLGVFPGGKNPRVLWVGVKATDDSLFRLQADLGKTLAAAGFPQDQKPFRAHLTLARFRYPPDPQILKRVLLEQDGNTPASFYVTRIVLYHSQLKPKGAEYSALFHYPTKGADSIVT